MHPRGKFIVLEGLDGAGTTTQVKNVEHFLKTHGKAVHCTREPSDRKIGKLIREYLSGNSSQNDLSLALLFAADRLEHVREEIEPALRAGTWVISDRYLWSSLAYQGLYAAEEWVQTLNQFAPAPDLYLFLRVRPEVAHERRNVRGQAKERFESDSIQVQVALRYEELIKQSATSHIVIDGEASVETVSQAICKQLDSFL